MSGDVPKRVVVRWAKRVSPGLIRRLYETDATGIRDEELVNEVGYALYARCLSIQRATAAHNGRVECPACGCTVLHQWGMDEILRCDCGWQMRWRSYRDTFHGRNLLAGGARAFAEFVSEFNAADTYRDKILAIDGLIHAFHVDSRGNASAPAARNVIEGNVREVLDLLEGLASSATSEPGLAETSAGFRETVEQAHGRGPLKRRNDESASHGQGECAARRGRCFSVGSDPPERVEDPWDQADSSGSR